MLMRKNIFQDTHTYFLRFVIKPDDLALNLTLEVRRSEIGASNELGKQTARGRSSQNIKMINRKIAASSHLRGKSLFVWGSFLTHDDERANEREWRRRGNQMKSVQTILAFIFIVVPLNWRPATLFLFIFIFRRRFFVLLLLLRSLCTNPLHV